MTPEELDVIVRVAGATLLLTAAVLLATQPDRRQGLFFLPFAVCLCGFLAGNTPDAGLRLTGPMGETARLLSGFAAVFLWWFCLSVFDRAFRPRGLVLATSVVWLAVAAADRGLFGGWLADAGLSWLLIVIGVGMVTHLAWRLIRDRPGDLIAARREARILVVALLAGQFLADLFIDVAMGFEWRPRAFTIIQNAALLMFTGCLLHVHLRSPKGPRPAPVAAVDPAVVESTTESPEAARLRERLRELLEVDRVHLDPDMTFDRFVALMRAPDRTVRRLINQELGYDHFRAFLNAHRMVEARRRLSDPAHRGDKLITVAMDSGFSSLASFNRVFQDAEACPPSAFRQAAQGLDRGRAAASRQSAEHEPTPTFEERSADS